MTSFLLQLLQHVFMLQAFLRGKYLVQEMTHQPIHSADSRKHQPYHSLARSVFFSQLVGNNGSDIDRKPDDAKAT